MKTIALGLSMAALLTAGSAYAAPDAQPAKRDPNAVVTRAEAQTRAAAQFARLDVNKDGKLDQSDSAARREAMKTRMFERLDANKDGQVTKAEFMAGKGRDGRGAGTRVAAGEPGKAHGGFGRHHGRRGGMMGGARMADADKNGAVSQAEFTSAALTRFDRIDADKDGKVTPQERQTAREAMKARWQQKRAEKATG